jgi:hypothetical protein
MSFKQFTSLSFWVLAGLISRPTLAVEHGSERRALVFYSGDIHGTIEPCGCTSDPLGDLARVTAIIRQANRIGKNVLFVDAGNLSFPAPSNNLLLQTAARLRADFIGQEFERLPLAGCAIGPADLSSEGKVLAPRRIATNVEANPQIDAFRLAQAGGIRFGILGYIDAQVANALGYVPRDATVAIRDVAKRLRSEGADILVLLAPVDRLTARSLARNLDLDFIVLGKDVGAGLAKAERIGDTYLLAPSEETQRLGRLEIVLPSRKEAKDRLVLIDAGGVEHNRNRMAELQKQHTRLEDDLQRWKADPTADASFIQAKSRESEDLQKELQQLQATPWTPPREGPYFTNTLIPIQRHLVRDPVLVRSMRKLDEAIASASLKLAEPPPPAEAGQAKFLGDAKCVSCHKAAARSFATTRHAQAWRTLVKAKKTGQEDCVSCHVTGYGEIGGSSFGFTKGLENVQCETCHGPGSIHVEKRGKESPFAGQLKTPESLCVRCHNEKHSDTFQYEAYLRDVIGPGHGEDARDALGPGPTGKELRRAAIHRSKKP